MVFNILFLLAWQKYFAFLILISFEVHITLGVVLIFMTETKVEIIKLSVKDEALRNIGKVFRLQRVNDRGNFK